MNSEEIKRLSDELLAAFQETLPSKTASGREIPSPVETLKAAFACKTREEATALIDTTTDILAEAVDSTPYKFEQLLKDTIAREALNESPEISKRIYDLFDAEHPVFGNPHTYWAMTLEQVFEKNKAWSLEQDAKRIEAEKTKKEGLKAIDEKLARLKKGQSAQAVEDE